MNRTFSLSEPFRIPDGTLVSPFLNCKDGKSGLPFDLLEGFSIAAGTIEARSRSKIHVMPFVTQVTFVRSGELTVRMKRHGDAEPYEIALVASQAVITEAGTFFQLDNLGDEPSEVLYIVSPPYLFDLADEKVVYDDSVLLDRDWHELDRNATQEILDRLKPEHRTQAEARLAKRGQRQG